LRNSRASCEQAVGANARAKVYLQLSRDDAGTLEREVRPEGVLQAMIDGIRVDARDHIEPTLRVPAVRIESVTWS
jgi:hypothetical protein